MLVKNTVFPEHDGPTNMLPIGNLGTMSPECPCLQVCYFNSMGFNFVSTCLNIIYKVIITMVIVISKSTITKTKSNMTHELIIKRQFHPVRN